MFHIIVYQPLFNLLVFLYNVIPGRDIGVAIIVLTLAIKLLLHPFTKKSAHYQKGMQALSPQLKKLKEQHKDKPDVLTKETMKLYKETGVSPFGGCLPILIQLPLLIGLFQVFRAGFTQSALVDLYSFVQNPGVINPLFLGFLDLSKASIPVALLASAAQFIQGYVFPLMPMPSQEGSDMNQQLTKQMIFMAPILTFIISIGLPAALPFYWFFNSAFSAIEVFILKKNAL